MARSDELAYIAAPGNPCLGQNTISKSKRWTEAVDFRRLNKALLRNCRRAQQAGHVPLFVVAASDSADPTRAAARLENVVSSPVNDLDSGETRLYTTDTHITFEGGANAREGVTAVRPVVGDSRRSVWTLEDDGYVLSDGKGTVFATIASFDSLSRSDVPGVYSYDRAAEEYVVYEHNRRHVYDRKEDFEHEWVPIRRPFVPDREWDPSTAAHGPYEIVVADLESGDVRSYRDGELFPLETLLDAHHPAPGEAVHPADSPLSPSTASLPALEAGTPDSDADSSTADADPDVPTRDTGDSSTADDASDPVDFTTFVAECVREEPGAEIPKDDLYEVYLAWAATHGQDPYAKSWFGRKLSEHVSVEESRPTRDGERIRCYAGLSLTYQGIRLSDQQP
ncbi:winged helix-turn-helix domain-containing protein [Natronobiforma cellulositropha]|uniref:winged helix-turn-helix domain-containing protein n=1 Tax=Natronobiforma cellulositropha TaxID=1679076 RepID=UPI0021D599E3|nr:winged helix-turn-helix domain-containing protein [Natronobiforma cellulositropha]